MKTVLAIVRREFLRFRRQPVRAIATIGTPVVFLISLGAGFAGELRDLSDGGYAGFLLPGMIAMATLFAGAFGAMSLIEDRDSGPLLAVLAGPAKPWSVGLGKVVALGLLAMAQAVPLLLGCWLLGLRPTGPGVLLSLFALAMLAFGTTGFSLALAWRSADATVFHSAMNIVLLPAWMLAGAFYPADTSHPVMRWLTMADPLAWPVASLRLGLTGDTHLPGGDWIWLVLATGYGTAGVVAGMTFARRR